MGSTIHRVRAIMEVLAVSAKLGLTSFGGPAAHLAYFHNEYVRRRRWLDERSYADLVALCQFLPGPASSQVSIAIGLLRAGLPGGLAAWLGFTLPSAVAMVIFALLMKGMDVHAVGWLHGLKLVALAIVAHAVYGMSQRLAAGRTKATIAVAAAVTTWVWSTGYSQLLLIAAAGAAGVWLCREEENGPASALTLPIGRGLALGCLGLFASLLLLLPLLREIAGGRWLALLDSFYRSGAMVFGGGHVVLPLLEREVVESGWVSAADFLAGYGAAQTVPGPLFTFASYLGALAGGSAGAVIATLAIFLPAFLLVAGTLPFWQGLRASPWARGTMAGMNAAVVGLLLAALYDPLWTTTIGSARDAGAALGLFGLLSIWKLPPWVVVLVGALVGELI
ncbi:chromate efflux transporter [Paenibacillus sp. SYP-B4298]|uniref:chromate efflux transporter n=1 Tax=Paenibacillus sp. SYP-B4298 TaxID=2996034 RepID=UPI0022DE31F4|nr:chromate efflux transporter [Paenibacillus sp. SYP-B4298]